MRPRLIITFLLWFVALTAAAQTTRIRGRVTDADTGEPLPFVGIYFDGTTIGISTDLDGHYSLETRSKDAKVLTASLIGYESQSFAIVNGSFSEVNFRLKLDVNQLNAALVKPDDRYIKSILRKLDQARKRNNPENAPDWRTSLYSKIEMDATNLEDLLQMGFLNKNLGFLLNYTDTSAVTGKSYIPIMISENVSDLYHSQDPAFNREIMRASQVTGLEDDNAVRQFTGAYLLKTNFYESTIGVFNLDIPCPAAASSHIFYNYYLVDSLQVEGRKTYVLRFHPKKLVTSPVLDGEMQIDAEDFGIRSVHAQLSAAANVNWIRHINVDLQNRRLPDGRWFYGEERLFIDFSISVSDNSRIVSFLGNRHIVFDEPVFEPVTDPVVLSNDDPVVMSEVEPQDSEYWNQNRPYALTEREKGIFRMVDEFQQGAFYKWAYNISRALIVSYIEVKPVGIEFGPWARTVSWNDTEGLRLQLGGRTLKEFSKKVRLGAYVAYGFKDEERWRWKWYGQSEFILDRQKTKKITLTAQRDYQQLGSGSGVFTAQNLFSSLFARSHADKQSMMRYFIARYDHEFTNWFNGVIQWRTMRLWGNETIPLIRPDGTIDDSFSVNELHATLRFAVDERVNRGFFEKLYIFTKYPVVSFDILGGFKGITANDFPFFRTDAHIHWNTPSNAIGFGKLNVDAGIIWGSLPYPLLKLHEGNQTYFLDRTAFACMDYYEFASDRWVSAFYEHNFNGFFLGKIPLIKKLDLREVATIRAAWGTISPANRENAPYLLPMVTGTLETPYVEAGIGLSNIFRILRVDAYWRLTHRRPDGRKNFTVNVGIDVDF